MGFDNAWFGELGSLTEGALTVVDPVHFRPTLSELREAGKVKPSFQKTVIEFIDSLSSEGHELQPEFRAEAGHIYTFPQGRAFRRQKNVGFYAGDESYMRIGLGFKLNQDIKNEGADDYKEFIQRVSEGEKEFKSLLENLGLYVEPKQFDDASAVVEYVTDRSPNWKDGWRFFGTRLQFRDPAHRWIMNSTGRLARFACHIFDRIDNSSF